MSYTRRRRQGTAARLTPLALSLALFPSCAAEKAESKPVASVTEAPKSPVFIEDDYEAALAKARSANVPLFVDAWAVWCHSCQSLRQYVFPAPEVRKVSGLAVFLSIDTENDGNAPFVQRFPAESLPTLFLIDPRNEKVLVKWTGAPSPTELVEMLTSGKQAYDSGEAKGAEAALLRGDRASNAENAAEAVVAYKDALATAPAAWPKRAHVLDSLTFNLHQVHAYKECFALGALSAREMPEGTPRANLIATTLGCGSELDAKDPAREGLGALAKSAIDWAKSVTAPILADDRSVLFEAAIPVLSDLGDRQGAHAAATEWATYLEGEAGRANTPSERAVFDPHRLAAYLELGTPGRAIPMLEQSARDFPKDYNPQARLAVAYKAMKRFAEASMAIERAIGLGYGPRRVRLFLIKADIEEARGDKAKSEAALKQALDVATNDPMAKLHVRMKDQVERRIQALRSLH